MTTDSPVFLEPTPWLREGEEKARQSPVEIIHSAQSFDEFRRNALRQGFSEDALLDDVPKIYSTSQAAAFLGRSPQWIYWGFRNGVFTYKDGTLIQPETAGKMRRRRFTLPLIREMALSHHRRGNMTEEELEEVMKRILLASFGPDAFSDTR